MRQIILDTETTGLSAAGGDRLTEIGCLEMIDRMLTGRKFQTHLNPEREVSEGASRITGLTWEFLKDKPRFSEVVDEFLMFIEGAELVIHNAPFDLSFLNHELSLVNHPWGLVESRVHVVDTLEIARKLHPGQRNNLDALCKRYQINNSHRVYHGALLDAEILASVYLAMTQGQISMGFGDAALNARGSMLQKVAAIEREGLALTIVRASDEELALHQAYLGMLSKESEGHCLWSELEK